MLSILINKIHTSSRNWLQTIAVELFKDPVEQQSKIRRRPESISETAVEVDCSERNKTQIKQTNKLKKDWKTK